MLDTRTEAPVMTSYKKDYFFGLAKATRETVPVNSMNGIKSLKFDKSTPDKGLYTCGLSTCTAVGGYYLKGNDVHMFLAHISPIRTPAEIFKQLDMEGVEGVSMKIVNGTATKPERNERLKQAIDAYFKDKHINTREIPPEQQRTLKVPPDTSPQSMGMTLKYEKTEGTAWQPMMTTIEEV